MPTNNEIAKALGWLDCGAGDPDHWWIPEAAIPEPLREVFGERYYIVDTSNNAEDADGNECGPGWWIDRRDLMELIGECPVLQSVVRERVRKRWCRDTVRWIRVEYTAQPEVAVGLAELSTAFECGYNYVAHFEARTEHEVWANALVWLEKQEAD